MCDSINLVLLVGISQTCAGEFVMDHSDDLHAGFANALVRSSIDKLADRTFDMMSHHQSSLESTMLGKSKSLHTNLGWQRTGISCCGRLSSPPCTSFESTPPCRGRGFDAPCYSSCFSSPLGTLHTPCISGQFPTLISKYLWKNGGRRDLFGARTPAGNTDIEESSDQTLDMLDQLLESETDETVPEETAFASQSSPNFDVVEFRNPKTRTEKGYMFRKAVKIFKMPGASDRWSDVSTFQYETILRALKRAADRTPVGGSSFPVLAMNGRMPCAVALYVEPDKWSDRNTFVLSKLIRNNGAKCKGAGAAILCHLIRNSKNLNSEFSPLKLEPLDEPMSRQYFESFGCISKKGLLNPFDKDYYCVDRNPQKCNDYVYLPSDANVFFRGWQKRAPT